MRLPLPFLKSNTIASEYYLALILTDEKAGALILRSENGNLQRVNSHEAFFPESLDEISLDDLITTIDKAISRSEELLPPNIQTHQTIFGVKDKWVDNETKKIKKDYLEKLKKVCNALDLTPIGFMVTTEAITHLMLEEEGAPVSAVFAEIGKKYINLSLLRGGKIIESVSSPHLESLPITVDKLIGHFTVPVLPARIVIFQSKPNERTAHAFLTHQWSNQLPFLHVPQVTVLPAEFDLKSVMSGAATQMGFTLLENKTEVLPKLSESEINEEFREANEDTNESSDNTKFDSETQINSDQTDEGIAESESVSDFGFIINQDITQRIVSHTSEDTEEEQFNESLSDDEQIDNETESSSKGMEEVANDRKLINLTSLKFLKNFKMPKIGKLNTLFTEKKTAIKIIIPFVILVILIVATIYFYYNKMQANVLLTMTPNSESQDESVTFSIAQSNDYSNNVIAAKILSASIPGQATANATGSKDVGDKAKGTVTIYNNNENSVTLNSGSTLTANNGQVFLLDSTVTVASASGNVFSGTTPGTTQATVTANDIGTNGNEPSGTEFTIGSDNTVAAKNDNAFSGGTTKTVTVVSENDIANLRTELPKNIQGTATQKLTSQADSGFTVLPITSNPVLEDEVFDHHVGDEASQVSLNASVVYTGFEYKNSDLDTFAKNIMKQKYTQDPNIANNSVKETISDAQQKSSQEASATVTIQAGLLPNIDEEDVISAIQKKSVSDAKTVLGNLPQVQSADITFTPAIPFLPYLFPSLPHQINVTESSQ